MHAIDFGLFSVDEGVWAGEALGVGPAAHRTWEAIRSTAACRVDGQVAQRHASRRRPVPAAAGHRRRGRSGARRASEARARTHRAGLGRASVGHRCACLWTRLGRDAKSEVVLLQPSVYAFENQTHMQAFIRTCRTASRRERQCGKSCWRFFPLGETKPARVNVLYSNSNC